jgi:hypothetical protein
MPGPLLAGLAAGAVGTVALNVTTYVDMALRGRSSSNVPAKVAGTIAEKAHVPLKAEDEQDSAEQSRRTALGQLMGYVTGLGVGAAYGLVRPHARDVPWPLLSFALGAAAMAGSDLPATVLGVTNPKEWPASSWAADIVPHLAYGLATALAYDGFDQRTVTEARRGGQDPK